MATAGAIAAGDPQTARAGLEVLDAGGNAIDAVCAAAFTSFVVEPPLTSPAGGGALLYGHPQTGWESMDFMAAAPGLGLEHRPSLDFFDVSVDFGPTTQVFHVGRGAAAAPCLLQGLIDVHQRAGRMPLSELLQPAIAYGRDGFVLSEAIHWINHLLEPIVTLSDGVRAIHCDGPDLAPAGAVLDNPRLASFLEALGQDPDAALAAFDQALVRDFGPERGGLITRADLGRRDPRRAAPRRVAWHGVEVLVPPPPSAGGSLVGFALQLTERLGLSPDRFLAPEHLLAVADVLGMVSELRQAGYDAQISDPQAAREWLSTAQVDQWALRLAAARESRHFGSTTHISVADGQDGAASLTTSNGEGCGYTITDLGIHVNNFMGEEDINPAGFHVHPSGQPLSTMMSPAIALQDGRPTLVLGSGGSNRIRSVVYQGLLNRLYFGRTLDEALRAPRVHVEGARLWFESTGLSERSTEALLASWEGATRFPEPNMFFGGVHAVAREGDRWIGAGDRRRGGVALVQDA